MVTDYDWFSNKQVRKIYDHTTTDTSIGNNTRNDWGKKQQPFSFNRRIKNNSKRARERYNHPSTNTKIRNNTKMVKVWYTNSATIIEA